MIKRRVKRIKSKVSDKVVEKATEFNPLTPRIETPSLDDVPRITDKNITEHREQVLSGARKFIYPLQHSKRRIVTVTLSIIAVSIVGFLIYCSAALYRYYQYNSFLYRVTQVVPFPIARVGSSYVYYENYLFELRHYVHYYQTQQQQVFNKDNKQLLQFRKQALADVINTAYVKKLAKANNVSVSNKEVDGRIAEVRSQNRLGSSDKVFADVLRDYWGWSVADFRRSLKDQMLGEKVTATLDKADMRRAQSVLAQLKGGADFGAVAKAASDDPSAKSNGGDYGSPLTKDDPNIAPQVAEALFKLNTGQISGVINAGPTLEIVKLNTKTGNSVTAQHISIKLQNIAVYINQVKAKQSAKTYVHF